MSFQMLLVVRLVLGGCLPHQLDTKKSRPQVEDVKICKDDMGVSKNRGTPKWMVYDGKPYQNG